MTPRVSIIIATYNYGHYLPGALDSALRQTFDDLEVIVVDDGSSDDTPQVMDRYRDDPRIRYCRTDHLGQPAAKNLGIRQACGRWIAFLDADDLWLPEKLQLQLPLFDRDPRIGVVYSRFEMIDAAGAALVYEQPELFRGDVAAEMFRQNFVGFSTSVVRREVFDEVGLFDERIPLAIDYEFWLRAALRWRFDYVDRPLVRYRTGHANLSARSEERLAIALAIMDEFLAQPQARQRIAPAEIARAYCETYCSVGLVRRERSTAAAVAAYLRAIGQAPLRYEPWRGLAAALLPERLRRLARRALGRPIDWHERPRAPAEPLPTGGDAACRLTSLAAAGEGSLSRQRRLG